VGWPELTSLGPLVVLLGARPFSSDRASRGDPLTPRRISELGRRERRLAVARTALIVLLAWVLLIGVYYLVPAGHDSATDDLIRLVIGVSVVALVIAWQASHIVKSEIPELRAAQSLGVILPLFLVVFSSIYLSLSDSSRFSFSQPLDHTSALYFTITVFSTVGFGDITPRTDSGRILVSVQMLLDLVIIGAVARILINAAKMGLARNDQSSPQG
jgi:voltage-gated potassium channel